MTDTAVCLDCHRPLKDPGTVRTIVVAAMNALDGLIAQAHEDDIDWPTEGDLPLIFTPEGHNS